MYITKRLVLSPTITPDIFSGPPAIGLDNIFSTGALTVSSQQPDFTKENATDTLSYTFWRPASLPATLEVSAAGAQYIDYFALASHTLGSSNCTFNIEYFNGVAWVIIAAQISPVTDRVIFKAFNKIYTNRVRLNILSGGIPSVGVLNVGKAFVFQRSVFIGHSPIVLNPSQEFAQNISELDFDLGRSYARKGSATSLSVRNLKPDWIRKELYPLAEKMITKPFFFCWRPDQFAGDSAYCWLGGTYPALTNTGPNGLMSAEFSFSAMVL